MNYFITSIVTLVVLFAFVINKHMKLDDIAVMVYMKILYLYSYLQIQYSKYVQPYFTKNKIQVASEETDVSKMLLIKDGSIVKSREFDLSKLSELFFKEEDDGYDLLIFIKEGISTPMYYVYSEVPSEVARIKTSYMFLTIELLIDGVDKKYNVQLFKEGEYDFYLSGNVFDSDFWQYYIKQILLLDYSVCSSKYTLTIMDQNADVIELDNTKSVVLKNDEYFIQ